MTREEYQKFPDGLAVQSYKPYTADWTIYRMDVPKVIVSSSLENKKSYRHQRIIVPKGTILYYLGHISSADDEWFNEFIGEINGEPYKFYLNYETFGRYWHVPKELIK